jgi:hypothetical protein
VGGWGVGVELELIYMAGRTAPAVLATARLSALVAAAAAAVAAAAAALSVLVLLYAHFRYDAGERPMLQIARLHATNVSFFTRNVNVQNDVELRCTPSIDVFDPPSYPGAFLRAVAGPISASALSPQTCYTYRLRHAQDYYYGAFCTPPLTTSSSPSFTGMFGSCLAVNAFPPFHRVHAVEWAWEALRPHVAFVFGDLVYLDIEETWLWWLRVPARVAWARTWQMPSLERLFRAVPAVLMHDDHEVENGWTSTRPLQGSPARHVAALSELDIWTRDRRQQVWQYGKDVSVFIADTRSFRTITTSTVDNSNRAGADDVNHTSILGAAQWQQLEAWLASPSLWHILVSPTLFARSMKDADGWGPFIEDRRRFLSLAPNNTVIFSGDVHWALAVEHNRGGRTSVWEFGASPFQGLPFPLPTIDPDSDPDESSRERVHFMQGLAYFHGDFEYDSADQSLAVRLRTTSPLTGSTALIYEKRLSPASEVGGVCSASKC